MGPDSTNPPITAMASGCISCDPSPRASASGARAKAVAGLGRRQAAGQLGLRLVNHEDGALAHDAHHHDDDDVPGPRRFADGPEEEVRHVRVVLDDQHAHG
jgi:hypothetical protein